MLSRLDIILIVVSVIALLFAVQLIYLRSRDRRLRDIADRLRHGPDDVFLVRMVGALKSPLTMISGPVEHLDASSTLSEEDRKMLDLMKTSVERMDRIVGQLSDYTRKDFKGLRLSLNRDFPVCSQIRSDMEYFRSNADLLGISIKEEGTDSELRIPLDLEKFENIFHNLLYGALKFVFREGEVCVRTGTLSGDEVSGRARIDRGSLEDIYFMLNIFHSGETLDEDVLEALFGKEYMYIDSRDFAGVGLYFAKALADAHKGFLWASNSPDGNGVDFTLALPMDEEAYSPDDFVQNQAEKAVPDHTIMTGDSGMKTVLIVEEDADMLSFMSLLLQNEFTVKACSRGDDAEDVLRNGTLPDIVIVDSANASDSAIGLCRAIRRNDITFRIPIIMITSERTDDGKIDAIEAGADVMIEHPFKPAMLTAMVKSLIRKRDQATGHLIDPDEMGVTDRETSIVSEEDRLLFDALCNVIRENAGNPDLTVPLLCEMLHISRTKLYTKVNGMTGMSPKRFLHDYRLKIAAHLLSEGGMTVSEVADATGFNSPSYFSKAFRKHYGRMPSEMKKQ